MPVRDDLRALEGYHSAQVDVDVRLNTNDRRSRRPAAWRAELAARWLASTGTATPTGRPRRCARRSPSGTASARPGVRRQRLERGAADVAAHLRRSRPHGRHVRADVPAARPHRPDHRGHGRRGRARRRLHARPVEAAAASSTPPVRRSRSCARRTTRRAWSRPDTVRAGARRGARAGRRRRGVRPVRRLVGARPRPRRPCRWSVVRTFSKTWSMAGARLGYARRARRGWSPSSTRSSCRTTSTRPSRSPAGWHCATSTRWTPGQADRRRARAGRRGASAALPRRGRSRAAPTSCCSATAR